MAHRYQSWSFTAEGTGGFPWDMLRYDACHPATEADVRKAMNGRGRVAMTAHREARNSRPLATERWASFLWTTTKPTDDDRLEPAREFTVATEIDKPFPLAMLARASCHPVSGEDTAVMFRNGARTVKLVGYGEPTTDEETDWWRRGWIRSPGQAR